MFYNKDEPKKRIFSYNSKNNKIKSKIEEINDKDKVFGAHFDEGRITRILDWGYLIIYMNINYFK